MLTSQCLEDDAAEVARERVALLELSQAGVNLMEFTRIMAEQLPQDQEGLDLVEESVAQAKETTRQAAPSLNLQKISAELGAKGCVWKWGSIPLELDLGERYFQYGQGWNAEWSSCGRVRPQDGRYWPRHAHGVIHSFYSISDCTSIISIQNHHSYYPIFG